MTFSEKDREFMQEAIELSQQGMDGNHGGPFGAVVVKDGKIIGKGFNRVISSNDPTAHAEIIAIREACKKSGSHDLSGCTIYVSCEPCPMCLSAIYWANIEKVCYANTKRDADSIGFRDDFLYEEICRPIEARKISFRQLMRDEANSVFIKWQDKPDRVEY